MGVWISGGNLGTAVSQNAGAGTQVAGLSFGGYGSSVITEEYNGASWSVGGDLSTGRPELAGCGSQSAGLGFGGFDKRVTTEEYNGTIWSAGGDLSTGRSGLGGCGTQSAGLSFGGWDGSRSTVTEEYDGTAWSAGGGLLLGRSHLAGCGTQSAGLSFGGRTTNYRAETEEYNGTTWSSGGDLLLGRSILGGCGTQSAGLSFGGYRYSIKAETEEYNGTIWSAGGDLSAVRQGLAGCGTPAAGLSFGGDSGAGGVTTTEEYFDAIEITTDLLDGKIKITNFPTDLLDGKTVIKSIATDLLDGKTIIESIATDLLDGKAIIKSAVASLLDGKTVIKSAGADLLDGKTEIILTDTDLLDGKTVIKSAGADLLDGKTLVKSAGTDLLDGKTLVKSAVASLLDGKTVIKSAATNLLDGKLTLALLQRQKILNSLGFFTIFLNILTPLGITLDQLIVTPIAQTKIQSILNQLSTHITNLQSVINQLTIGDPFTGKQDLLSSIQSDDGSQIIINELSLAITKIQAIKNTLSESLTHKISLINELALKNDIQGVLTLINGLSEQTTFYPNCTIDVYLEGKKINKKINSLNITMDREVLFDTLSFSSTDKYLYSTIQNIVGTEEAVEIQYKGTSWMFLVEDVSGYELDFTVWGRSIAAKSDTPFKDTSDFILDTDILASDLAEDLVPDLAVTWNTVDWIVSEGWTATGTPVQKLQELADSVNAVVRMYPDGTGLYVDQRYLTRPIDLPYAAVVEEFDRDTNLVSLDNSRIIGTKDNAVTVYGYSSINERSVMLESESCVEIGNTALIKVYPGLGGVGYVLESSADSPIYQYKKTEKFTETIVFVGGKGRVNYPIVDIESISWDGVVPSAFDYTIGQNEIIIDDIAAVGEVVYSTSYDVWYAGHSGEGQIVVVCVPENGGGIVARVYFSDGDREAESVDKPTLSSIEAATVAGTAHLDNTSYTKLLRKISTPCSGVFDGDIVSIQSTESGVTGNAIVMRHEINAELENNTLKIWSIINVVQFK